MPDAPGSSPFRPLLVRALFLPVLLVLAFAGVMLWQVTRLISASGWVDHTDQVIASANELRALHADLQTGVRGYLITADPVFRMPYDRALPQIDPAYAALERLVGDNPAQQDRVRALRAVKDRWLDYVNLELHERETGGPWEAAVRAGPGRIMMEDIDRRFSEFVGVEQSLRDQRSIDSRQTAAASLWFTGGMVVLLGIAMLLLSKQQIQTLTRTYEAALIAANQSAEALESMVKERTAQLAAANANLEVLAADQRQAAEELAVVNARLEISNRELQDFASVASHDLQEPLRKVQAFGDRLKNKCAHQIGSEGVDYLDRMLGAAARMKTLINDLLTFARVTSCAQPFAPVDLKAAAELAVSNLEARIEQNAARVQIGELPTIDADPVQMAQLLQNLIGNAVKFARPGVNPLVSVSATIDDDASIPGRSLVRLSVRDNGIGFDEKYTDRIFTVFQRLHGRGEYEGTGIGLAVCRKIAERHHGSISVQSRMGEGATFTVSLPLRQPNAVSMDPAVAVESNASAAKGAA